VSENTSSRRDLIVSLVLLVMLTGSSIEVGMLLAIGRLGLVVSAVVIMLAIFAAVTAVVVYQPLKAVTVREQEMTHRTTTDALTGLQTRHQILERLSAELNRAIRSGQPLSCAVVDIDHFREINNRFGEAAGDSVLRSVGNLIAQCCRQYDTAGRYDAEDFLVILPAAEMDDAARAAERLRRRIEASEFACHGEGFKVTVSIGVTQVDIYAGETMDVLIARAYKALERARAEGRNRLSALTTLAFVERAIPPAPTPPPGVGRASAQA